MDQQSFLTGLFEASVRAADPRDCLRDVLPERPVGRTVVIALGKGAAQMAAAFEDLWGEPVEGVRRALVPVQQQRPDTKLTQPRLHVTLARRVRPGVTDVPIYDRPGEFLRNSPAGDHQRQANSKMRQAPEHTYMISARSENQKSPILSPQGRQDRQEAVATKRHKKDKKKTLSRFCPSCAFLWLKRMV